MTERLNGKWKGGGERKRQVEGREVGENKRQK